MLYHLKEESCELTENSSLIKSINSQATEIDYIKPLIQQLRQSKDIDERSAVLDIITLLSTHESSKSCMVQNGILLALQEVFEGILSSHKDVVGIDVYRKIRHLLQRCLETLLYLVIDDCIPAQQTLADLNSPLIAMLCELIDLRRGQTSSGFELFGDSEAPAVFSNGIFTSIVQPISSKSDIAFWVTQALGNDSFLWSK